MIPERTLTFGVILPHTKIFGGVKRFFEIGNILIGQGHRFIMFTPSGEPPDWFDFRGEVTRLGEISSYRFDALFITQDDYMRELKEAKARLKFFYAILQRPGYLKSIRNDPDVIVVVNSTALYNSLGGPGNKNLFKAIGGVDIHKFSFKKKTRGSPGEPFIVMVYGRFYKRKKGTRIVVKACERLYKSGHNIKLHLFDTPTDEYAAAQLKRFSCNVPHEFFINYPVKHLQELYYKADVFVSAERNAGWSNTSAEAMACGVPVVATRSGTADFLVHNETGLVVWRHSWFIERAIKVLYESEILRNSLARNAREKIEEFAWEKVASTIDDLVRKKTIT